MTKNITAKITFDDNTPHNKVHDVIISIVELLNNYSLVADVEVNEEDFTEGFEFENGINDNDKNNKQDVGR